MPYVLAVQHNVSNLAVCSKQQQCPLILRIQMKLYQVINDCCYSSYCYATAKQFSCSEGMQGQHINDQTSTHGLEQQSVKTSENQSNRSIKMVPKDLKLE